MEIFINVYIILNFMRVLILLGLIFVIVLCSLGIVFSSLLFHEGVHVFQSPAPMSVCYDFGQVTFMHVFHNTSSLCVFSEYNYSFLCDEGVEFNKFRLYSEKCAFIIERLCLCILSIFFYLICVNIKERFIS